MSDNEVVYICCDTYRGKPNKTPSRVKGDRKRAIELNNKWTNKHRYSKEDRYLNS
jgi:hypothetical protein